jgi:integrase
VVLTPIQVQALASELHEPQRTFVLLLVLTGLRVGELLALRRGCARWRGFLNSFVRVHYDAAGHIR